MRALTRSSLRQSLGQSLGRSLGLLRSGPRVTVVVWVPERAAFLDESVASIRASTGVRTDVVRVPEGASVDQAVASASGDYLAFLSADDVLTREGLGRLVAALADGADVAVGRRECRRAGRTMPVPAAGAPTDLSLGGKLFRLSAWRAAGAAVGEWDGQVRAVHAALRAAARVVVVPDLVAVEHDRDTTAPIHEQRRFRADRARARFAALRDVLATEDREWRLDAVRHLLPGVCRDAVGGRSAYFAALQPFAREVVDGLPDGCAEETPVEARLVAWVAAHGSLDDVALVEDHLAGNRHGLPVTDGVADLPAGVDVPEDWRRIGAADRRLRSRVLAPVATDDGRLLVRGNALVSYAACGLPEVFVAGQQVEARPWADPTADAWARRAWEDRSRSGFEATLPRGDVPAGTALPVRVVLGGLESTHELRVPSPVPAEDVVDEVDLGPEGLRIRGAGRPVRLRLAGATGTGAWAEAAVDGDRFEAVLPLATGLFGEERRLPVGRYRLDAQAARGRPGTLPWSPRLLLPPPDLTDERTGLRLVEDGVVVGPPLTARDGSTFAQQQRITAYAAAPRAESPRTVLLESFHGRVVADNPAAIGRELARRREAGDLDLAWVVDDPGVNVPAGTRAAPRRTQAWYDALAGAHAYVGNAAAPPWFHKSDHQFHLQTWHGTPLKKIGEDRGPGDFNTWRHRRHLAGQAARWDAMISPSPYCSEIFRSAFRYDGPMLEIGYPRNDVLLSDRAPQVRSETRRRLGLTDAQRVLLYAPTWREYIGVRNSKPLFLDPARVVAAMPDVVVLVRGHYNASRQPDVFTDRSRIIDVTRYPDIADLYLAADSLVTDYSSVMFDFALTDKPMVLLTPDLDQYRDVERGFYFDIEAAAPGPMVVTTDEVLERLAGPDEHARSRERFRERFSPWDDGHAAARAVDHLLASW